LIGGDGLGRILSTDFLRPAAKAMEDLPPAQALLSLLQGLETKPDEAFMTQAQEMMAALVLESEMQARMEADKAGKRNNKRLWDDGDEVLGARKKRATVDGAADGVVDGADDGADDDEKEEAIVFGLEVTKDLCHWSDQWKRLTKEGNRKNVFFFLLGGQSDEAQQSPAEGGVVPKALPRDVKSI
jgi:hypothetical protein